jgi:acyl-CoA synthetase (NDP forming)
MQDAFRLLSLYGIPVPGHAFVANPNEAVAAAKEIGFPVVLKFDVSGVVHKTEAGAVRLGIRDEAALREAYGQAAGSLAQRGLAPASCVVMATIASAPEVLVGAVQDPLFGPIVACGTGGIYTEILRDVRFALAPLSRPGAKRMVAALGSQPILAGARGAAPGDVEALEQALTCIAQLVADLDDVAELDINPVRVLPRGQGIVAVDVRVRLRASKRP